MSVHQFRRPFIRNGRRYLWGLDGRLCRLNSCGDWIESRDWLEWDEFRLDPEGDGKEARIKLVPLDQIAFDTDPRHLVRGLIPLSGLLVVWGPPKSGKSFWVFDVAMHVARGKPYRGRKVQQGPIVYCAFEGQRGIRDRIEAYRRHRLNKGERVPFYLQPVTLDLVADHAELADAIRRDAGKSPALVVLDTLNQSLRGSENSDQDMSAYVRAANALRQAFDCAVIIIHHCGHDQSRPRGHTALIGAADAMLSVKRDAADNILVTVESMKDGDAGEAIASHLQKVVLGKDRDGAEITSCVVEPVEIMAMATTTKPVKLANSAKIARDSLIDVLAREGKIPPRNGHIPDNTPTVSEAAWRADCYARGISKGSTHRARELAFASAAQSLQAKGLIGRWEGECWTI